MLNGVAGMLWRTHTLVLRFLGVLRRSPSFGRVAGAFKYEGR